MIMNIDRWQKFTLMEQLGNVGSEIDRALHWARVGKTENMRAAADRALELLDLTIADPRSRPRRKELLRAREVVADRFYDGHEYPADDASLQKYFLAFGLAARKDR